MAINVHLDWWWGSTTLAHSACLYSSSLSVESRPTINKPRATPNFRNFSCVFNAIAILIGNKRRKRRAFRLGGMCPVRKRTRRMEHEAPFPQHQQQKSNQMLRNEMKRWGLSMRNEREESELSGSINFRLLSSLPSPPPSVKRFPWPLIDIEFFCLLFTSSRIITSTHHFSLFVALWRLILSNPTEKRSRQHGIIIIIITCDSPWRQSRCTKTTPYKPKETFLWRLYTSILCCATSFCS